MKLNEMYSNKHQKLQAPPGYVFLREAIFNGELYWLIRTEPAALSDANDLAAGFLVERDDRIIGIKLAQEYIWADRK